MLRRQLGVPDEAQRVLVFGESSHWDPNWLYTSEQYYHRRIRHILDAVLDELSRHPRRVFSLESLFFLKLYWEREPARREMLRQLVNSGRLKLTGTGITTPDTLLPDTEAILRDYLHGQEWLREQGMTNEPRLAYLPDDFGHSPLLPSILRALGFEQAGITRIDGMYFVGCDYRGRSSFPLSGSSAELLQNELKTLDFVWRASDGTEILAHWNAFTYFQGDMLAHLGIIRWMGTVFGVPWRNSGHVARQIRKHVRRLEPLARTPYLFCPIGCDFNGPIPDLVDLLDRHNEENFERTGVWAVSAGLDDYLDLVDHHRTKLPVVELDPNPYWMGFYASRPQIKRCCNHIARKLGLAERLASARHIALPHHAPADHRSATRRLHGSVRAGWDMLVVANHHDFITGTSSERVWRDEQRPWLARAEAHADQALAHAATSPRQVTVAEAKEAPRWRLSGGRLEVSTRHYRLVMAEEAGGCIVSYRAGGDEPELLAGPANDLVLYRDTGGLWRMGHEYRGGAFAALQRASDRPARIEAEETEGGLQVRIVAQLGGRSITRWLWLAEADPVIRFRIAGSIGPRRTVTCRVPTVLRASELAMDVPGGVVSRPHRKLFDPTFWPARSFVHLVDERQGWGLAAFLGGPACAGVTEAGAVEWVVLRNAPKERAYRLLPLLSHPAAGPSGGEQILDGAVWVTPAGDYRAHRLPAEARRILRQPGVNHSQHDAAMADSLLITDCPEVMVTAIKVASRGAGLIVRLESFAAEPVTTRLSCSARPIRAARRCDARERDREPLDTALGSALVPISEHITSVRLLFS